MSVSDNLAILHDTIAKRVPEAQRATMETYLRSVMMRESSGNANAQSSSSTAGGLFQFIDSTWDKYGGGKSKFDPVAQCEAVIKLTMDNDASLRSVLGGKEPSPADYYLAHFLGAGGARKVLSAGDDAPIKGLVTEGTISANNSMRPFNGKRFSEFTVRDLREWAATKMDMSASELYSLRRSDGWQPTANDDDEERKRRQRFADGYNLNPAERALMMVLSNFLMAIFGANKPDFGQDPSSMPFQADDQRQGSIAHPRTNQFVYADTPSLHAGDPISPPPFPRNAPRAPQLPGQIV